MNFTDQLMQARRKASLGGRPLTKQETAGIVAGYADTASDRLTRAKTVTNQETQLDLQAKELKLAKQREENLMRLAGQARDDDRSDQALGVGLAVGGKILEPALDKIGSSWAEKGAKGVVDLVGGWFGW